MDKSIRVQVKEPCHENWQNMTENEKGRFCASCQKTVVDFTLMNDRQILDHLSKASGSTCGRFGNDQLDRELKAQVVKPKSKWAYFINLLIPIFLSISSSNSTKGEPAITSNSGNHADSKKDFGGILGGISVSTFCPAPQIVPIVDTIIMVEDKVGDLVIEPNPLYSIKEVEVVPDTMVKFIPPVIAMDDTISLKADTLINYEVDLTLIQNSLQGKVGGFIITPTLIQESNSIIEFAKDTLVKLESKDPSKHTPILSSRAKR